MRLLLLSDGAVGLSILEWLSADWHSDLGLVVTLAENELSKLSMARDIPTVVFTSAEDLKNTCWFKNTKFDLGVLAWWPNILGTDLLTVPTHGFINTHPSLLPYNRGKHYNFWAIVEQAPFGVTLHRVNSGVDTSDIVAQQQLQYDWTDTGGALYARALEAMINLFKDTYHPASDIHLDSIYTDREIGRVIAVVRAYVESGARHEGGKL